MAGLPDAADIAQPGTHRDLQLFHPWDLTSEAAAQLALQCEDAALRTHKRITNSEGAGVSACSTAFWARRPSATAWPPGCRAWAFPSVPPAFRPRPPS
jgi:hypothetical protein